MPGNARAVLGQPGRRPAGRIVLPFRDLGLGTSVVLLAAGGVILGVQRQPPVAVHPGLCRAVRAAGRDCRRSGTPSGSWSSASWPVAAVCMAGLVNGRTLPAFVLAGIAWPLAGLRGLPWLGRVACARVTGLGGSAAALRTVVWSLLGVVVFGLLFASADAVVRRVGGRGRARTWSWTRSCCAASSPSRSEAWCWRRRTSPSTRPSVEPVPATRHDRSRAATSGWRRCCSSTRVFLVFLVAQAHRRLRRARLPRAHHRPDLRGVRAPGLRPAHRRHRADPAGGVGGSAQGARGRRAADLAVAARRRSACSAC